MPNYRRILSGIGITFIMLLLILAGSIIMDIYLNGKPGEHPSSPVGQAQDIFIDKNTLIRQDIYYLQSRRTISEIIPAPGELQGKNQAEIEALGWNIFQAEGGQIVIYKETDALTPEDAPKRHLKLYRGKLAAFAGPSTARGPLLEELGIEPDYLSADWQEELNSGGIDFESPEDLLTALESLDEY